jgi:hypothetical protein
MVRNNLVHSLSELKVEIGTWRKIRSLYRIRKTFSEPSMVIAIGYPIFIADAGAAWDV